MKTFAVVMAAGLIAVVQAQEQCAAVAANIPACAVCSPIITYFYQTEAYYEIDILYRSRRGQGRMWADRLRLSMQARKHGSHQ